MAIFRFDPNANALVFRAYVSDGSVVGLDMALDTGASVTTIPLWVARELSVDEAREQPTLRSTTAQGMVTVPVYTFPRVNALGQRVANLNAMALDLPPTANLDGLLGLNFLRNFKLFINFPKGKLTLLPGNANVFRRLAGFIELARVCW